MISFDYAQDRLFGYVFARLDPKQFRRCFLSWVRAISPTMARGMCHKLTRGQVVAVDGKKRRRSQDRRLGKKAMDPEGGSRGWMVSAWATENQLVLGQTKVHAKSNEITAIPELLRLLELTGCIVTIDALGCQTKIANTIVRRGGDYLLAVKENQGKLYEDLRDLFAGYLEAGFPQVPHDYAREVNKDHGRIEIRECWTVADSESLAFVREQGQWKNLRTRVMLRAERRIGNQRSVDMRYYISSLENNAQVALHAARGHWGLENSLHWELDLAFREDESRVRKDHAPENFAILRHMALNLLKQEHSVKVGIKGKRHKAGWDRDYLLKVLQG